MTATPPRRALLRTVALVAALLAAWGSAAQTYQRPADGYYYITNAQFPARYLYPHATSYYNNNASTPYLWTNTQNDAEAVWEIVSLGNSNTSYYNIIHHTDGKYIIRNGTGATAVHLATTADPGNDGQYRFPVSNGHVAIVPRGVNQNSGQNNSFNPYAGETGIIGLYRYDNDNASRWTLTPITTIAAPTISVTSTGTCIIAYGGIIDANVYYTLDGSTPSSASTPYTGSFSIDISQDVTIKAIAITTKYNISSDVTTYNYAGIILIGQDNWNTMTADGRYQLTEDITVSGSGIVTFTGSFDGNYHTVTGLTEPLFATVDGGTVKNVHFRDVSISGTYAGAVCGEAAGAARIYNCGVLSGTVSGTTAAGGLVGRIRPAAAVRVVNCYNYATVGGGTYAAGIVGRNEASVGDTRIAMCMMYGDISGGTNRSPVYAGNHISNNQSYNEYNYYRSRASLTYTAYNDQLAIDKDEFLTRFPFYRHILNTHRELAAYFLFDAHDAGLVNEIGHWALKPDVAPYPIVEPWEKNTRRTTVDIAAHLPSTAERYAGRLLDDITADNVYRGDGTQVTTMGTNGYLRVNVSINGSSYTADLPITDMDTLRHDFTWGKVVLPFANEFDGWTRDYSKICTGWKITAVTGGTTGTLENYDFADRDCTAKDIYNATTNPYIFAQGGNYIVPYGVTAITIEANFANAFYLSDAYADCGYNAAYSAKTDLGWQAPTTYHGRPVYTDLGTLLGAMSTHADPHHQAIVLVGNFHYNQRISGEAFSNRTRGLTIMSVDEDNNQEPDYGWYSFHTTDRTEIPPLRFDFVPNIGIGMAARVTNSNPNPSIGIWRSHGWFELTETCVSFMSECEISQNDQNATDNGYGNNRWIANSGFFKQIVYTRNQNTTKMSYVQIGGNAYVEQFYPGPHANQNNSIKLVPVNVTGGEIEECFMTGKGQNSSAQATGSNIYLWCAGGRIHKYLSAYMVNPSTTGVNVTVRADHALIRRFFGGGTSAAARITGNIDITMNNSKVDFFCGGPEFGDMAAGKTVTTRATGSTFGVFYGAGFGGTAITWQTKTDETRTFNADLTYTESFANYTNDRLKYVTNYGFGTCYDFDFIMFSGGGDGNNANGKGVARFYTGYAQFSLATTGSVTNTLNHCTILTNFYGGGCQGKVSDNATSTLTDCLVKGNAYAAGFKASANTLEVYPTTQPTYSVYTKETGIFSDFGTVAPETWTWVPGAVGAKNESAKELSTGMTAAEMATLGTVTGNTNLTIGGSSVIGTDGDAMTGNVFGGGEESAVLGNTHVLLKGSTLVLKNVYGGGNEGPVNGDTEVEICDDCSLGD